MESTSFGCLPNTDQPTPFFLLCLQQIWQLLVRRVLSYFSRLQSRIPSLAFDQCFSCFGSFGQSHTLYCFLPPKLDVHLNFSLHCMPDEVWRGIAVWFTGFLLTDFKKSGYSLLQEDWGYSAVLGLVFRRRAEFIT